MLHSCFIKLRRECNESAILHASSNVLQSVIIVIHFVVTCNGMHAARLELHKALACRYKVDTGAGS